MMTTIVVLVCLAPLALVLIEGEMFRREAKRMIAEGYRYEFVITCSADPGSWQWVKRNDLPRSDGSR